MPRNERLALWHCSGHGSFSSNKKLNDVVGNITHSSILVPYHGWRISHRTHHANHGHVENDESWYPTSKSTYDNMVRVATVFTPSHAVCSSCTALSMIFQGAADVFTPLLRRTRCRGSAGCLSRCLCLHTRFIC